MKIDCYKLNGYPAHYRISKLKKQAAQQANAAITTQNGGPEISAETVSTLITGQGVSRKQCDKLAHVFQSVHTDAEASNSEHTASEKPSGTISEEGTSFW